MKSELKMLYKKDAKLARQVAAALGYKITTKTTAAKALSDQVKELGASIVKDAIKLGYTIPKIKKLLGTRGKELEDGGIKFLKELMKKSITKDSPLR